MRRTALPRQTLESFRRAELIEPERYSPLGRPLYPSSVYMQIERIEELRVLGMNLDEVKEVFARDVDLEPAALLIGDDATGGRK
jgi:DNA-binding transcriptional MerR regulator